MASGHGKTGRLPFGIAFLEAPDAIAELAQPLHGLVGQRGIGAPAVGDDLPVVGQPVQHLLQLSQGDNDPPYGTERLYNGLRLARALLKREHGVTVFLLGDAVSGAKAGQKTPDGVYNAERMVKRVTTKGRVLLCGTCMDARGLTDDEVVKGAERSTMDALAEATEQADRVLTF